MSTSAHLWSATGFCTWAYFIVFENVPFGLNFLLIQYYLLVICRQQSVIYSYRSERLSMFWCTCTVLRL